MSEAFFSTITPKNSLRFIASSAIEPPLTAAARSRDVADAEGAAAEEIRRHAAQLRLFLRHQPAARQIDQRHVHRLHAVFLAHLHRARYLMDFALADEIADRRRPRHDFQSGHTAV